MSLRALINEHNIPQKEEIARAYSHSYQKFKKGLPAATFFLCIAYQFLTWGCPALALDFDLDLVASSSIENISNAIVERIGFDKSKFAESYLRIYLLENGEFVEIITPTVCISTLSKYYDIREDLHIFFMLSNQAGDIWVEDGLRYYMQSKEAGRHHLPHIHVDYRHESSATVSLYDG